MASKYNEVNEALARACGLEFLIPNYTSDLNAMARVRRVILERGMVVEFTREVKRIMVVGGDFDLLDAPADMQALAAYKVLKDV